MEQQLQEGFYRFRPTDSERLKLLLRFIAKQEMNDSGFITTNIDVYGGEEPWEIYNHGVSCGNDDDDNADSSNYRYFITKLKKKSKAGYNREVGNKGSWKQQDKAKSVHYENVGNSSLVVIGCKKSLCYVNKDQCYNQSDGHWLMKEYELSNVILQKFDEDCRDYVLCAIKRKSCSTDYIERPLARVQYQVNDLGDYMQSNSGHYVESETDMTTQNEVPELEVLDYQLEVLGMKRT